MKRISLSRSSNLDVSRKAKPEQSAKGQPTQNGAALAIGAPTKIGAPTSPAAMLQLQQTIGNRAVQRLMGRSQQPPMGAKGGQAPEAVQGAIDQARGGGQALDKTV